MNATEKYVISKIDETEISTYKEANTSIRPAYLSAVLSN